MQDGLYQEWRPISGSTARIRLFKWASSRKNKRKKKQNKTVCNPVAKLIVRLRLRKRIPEL